MSLINREQLIALYKQANFYENYEKGRIFVDTDSIAQNLQLAFNNPEITGWRKNQPQNIVVGTERTFFHEFPRSSEFGHFFRNIDELCQNKIFKVKNTRKFYIIDLKWDSIEKTAKPILLEKHETLITFIKLIQESAVFVDSATSRMVYIEPEKLEVDINYSSTELENLDTDTIKKFESFLSDDLHRKQKFAILAKAIVNQCKTIDAQNRFSQFLNHLKDVYETLDQDYATFAAKFSFDEVYNDIRNTKLEEQVKIHKVITDIQNQILGIPIATVIVATQFKTQSQVNKDYAYQFWVNSGVIIGVCIFSITMLFLIKNQWDSLRSIKLELERKNTDLQKRKRENGVSVYDIIVTKENKPPFEDLFKRINFQKIILGSISIITIVGLIVSFIFYCKITVPLE